MTESPWRFGHDRNARCIRTAHYDLYTTLEDRSLASQIAQLLEGGLVQYRRLTPAVGISGRPMSVYLFQYRNQWADFTEGMGGEDAPVYLQIVRGGYTHGDTSVCFYLGDVSTWSVVAHEGFHQYVGRHFQSRIPPFLEEGLACLFESPVWVDELPRWNLSINFKRMNTLREAVAGGELRPVMELIQLQAGDVVGESFERIEAFYAQAWALAKFLREADGGAHRPALLAMLDDAANGRLPAGGAVLEQYLKMTPAEIEVRYQAYIKVIVTEEYARQWRP